MLKFQAHKGVSTENPENTMAAFEAAVLQGYNTIEMDVSVTKDMKFVMHHDKTINRCGRNSDGSEIENEIKIEDTTYEELLAYDFGAGFARKFKGTKLPLLEDALEFCRENGIAAKIDNKYENFTDSAKAELFKLLTDFEDTAQLTCKDIPALKKAAEIFPNMHFHYDGPVDETTLTEINQFIPKERLTVWLPMENENTTWVKVAFADEATAKMVKKHGELGLWILSTPEELAEAEKLGADIIETNGQLKSEMNLGVISDLHTHSLCSHDSQCPVEEMQAAQEKMGSAYFATTDHCDTYYYPAAFVKDEIVNSFNNSKALAEKNLSGTTPLTGVELGDGTIYDDIAQEVADMLPYDVIIGSVHGVRFKEVPFYYSQVDFGQFSEEDIYEYLRLYFDDVLRLVETQDIDIMAHLTCPIRYITGKYGIKVDLSRFDKVIRNILGTVIRKSIALEVNTSSYHMIDDFMPGRDIIRRYRSMGGYLVTLGSDAHVSENASIRFDGAVAFLKEADFPDIYLYRGRKAIPCRIK